MNPPRVSVVIPSARGGPYLRESVGSVLAQSFADFEVIVVADGCPDDLDDLEALDGRIRIVRQANRGVSVARNVGVRASRSDLIAFLDDDDRMLEGRLAAQYEAMDGHDDVAVCHTQFRVIDANGVQVGEGYARPVQYLDLLRGELGVLMPSTAIRKALLQDVGLFDAALRTGEDVDLLLRLASQVQLTFTPEVLTEYRRHGNNASRDTVIAGQALAAVLAKHRHLAEVTDEREVSAAAGVGLGRMRRLTSAGYINQGRREWRRGKRLAALRRFAEAARLSPVEAVQDLVGNRRIVRCLRGAVPRRR